ncbi:MAG: YggT family protein [Candidatus Rokubacteria bacterium]|nr:YggT family protein [Candidatus Rokubacteria bacterium]
MSTLLLWITDVLHLAIQLYIILIIVRAVISWVSPDPSNPIVRFLYRVTEPILRPLRHRLPDLGGLDISPMVVILVLWLAQSVLLGWLREMADGLR